MKTIRLLYPDHIGGGLDTYYFGAELMERMIPRNGGQKIVRVDTAPPDGRQRRVENGIYGEDKVIFGIEDAQRKLEAEKPDRVITIGGDCLVSLAPFDYLHGLYKNTGIIWIDAHPDVSTPGDGYPNAHAMVLGSLLGDGAPQLKARVKNGYFAPEDVLYVGLQPVHDYQAGTLKRLGVKYRVQDESFVTDDELRGFMSGFEHILVHFDIDVLDEHFFHSTYFANPELVGDGSGGGRMTTEQAGRLLKLIGDESDVVGFTAAEYLPFDEHRLHKMFSGLSLFTE